MKAKKQITLKRWTFDQLKKEFKILSVIYQPLERQHQGARTLLILESRDRCEQRFVSWSHSLGLRGRFVEPNFYTEVF